MEKAKIGSSFQTYIFNSKWIKDLKVWKEKRNEDPILILLCPNYILDIKQPLVVFFLCGSSSTNETVILIYLFWKTINFLCNCGLIITQIILSLILYLNLIIVMYLLASFTPPLITTMVCLILAMFIFTE